MRKPLLMSMARGLPGALALTGLLSLPSAALANGILFVQAPEQWSGHVIAPTLEEALVQGRADCAANGVGAEDCLVTSWCQAAGWSVVIGVVHPEGHHWSEEVCGLHSREMALAAGELLCRDGLRGFTPAICEIAMILDREGVEYPPK